MVFDPPAPPEQPPELKGVGACDALGTEVPVMVKPLKDATRPVMAPVFVDSTVPQMRKAPPMRAPTGTVTGLGCKVSGMLIVPICSPLTNGPLKTAPPT